MKPPAEVVPIGTRRRAGITFVPRVAVLATAFRQNPPHSRAGFANSRAGDDADLDVNARGQVQALVERFDRLLVRLQDVDEPLVGADLELLAALAVDVRRAQHRVP